MKTKLNLAVIAVLLLSAIYLMVSRPEDRSDSFQKAGMNSIKCTAAKFLLGNVDTTQQIAPLFENLGNLHVPIGTNNEQAQKFFDQGVRLSYAFNHAEAHRSFMEASRLDPNAAMTYWGQAYALGANINDAFPDEERRQKPTRPSIRQENWHPRRVRKSRP